MFLDLLDQPINKGDLIIHIDKMGAIMGIVDTVTPKAVYYIILNRPQSSRGYFVRIKGRVLKVNLDGNTCRAGYPGKGDPSIESWLEEHRQYGRSC